MAAESAEPVERWPAKRRAALVVSILNGETSVAEAARTYGLTVAEVEDLREKSLLLRRTRSAVGPEMKRRAKMSKSSRSSSRYEGRLGTHRNHYI